MKFSRVVGTITGDATDLLDWRDLIEKIWPSAQGIAGARVFQRLKTCEPAIDLALSLLCHLRGQCAYLANRERVHLLDQNATKASTEDNS